MPRGPEGPHAPPKKVRRCPTCAPVQPHTRTQPAGSGARTPRSVQGTQPWPGQRWSQERGGPPPGTFPAKGTRPWDVHTVRTLRVLLRTFRTDLQLSHCPASEPQMSVPPAPQALTGSSPPTTAAGQDHQETRTCWPCKVRRPKVEGTADRGRGMPLPPRQPPAPPAVLTHPIPALRHLVEGGDTPRQGRANKGLSHRSLEAAAAPAGNQRLCDGAPLP